MGYKWCVVMTSLVFGALAATQLPCPNDPNCVCGGAPALELNCNIDGRKIEISLLPETYININCINTTTLNYSKLPKCANLNNTFKSVTFKNCPLPETSFKDVLENIGVSKTLALIFQNAKNISGYFDRKHFTGLQNLTKLQISVKGLTHLPDNLFKDMDRLQWLNIRSNRLNLSQELFKPLGRLETLEISHNHLPSESSNLFAHLSLLKKLSLSHGNPCCFSKDLFTGANVLEELDLSSTGLDELPESIFRQLKTLKRLTLFSNKFSSLPKHLFLNNDQLETVIMLNNDVELRKLPESLFGNLPNMKLVYLQRCGLEDVPYNLFTNSSRITIISLAYNNIRTLPESIFNDQINLFELDLCSNQLKSLGPKIFSSLVRLEKLNLAYNNLVKISGSTFAPLLSLKHFNIEHNKLKIIDSYLFRYNRQFMTISMAYNNLDLEDESLENNTWYQRDISPFHYLNGVKLLNLSHNSFKHTFKDWWENSHEVVDVSYNHLEFLRTNGAEHYVFKGPLVMKEVWIANNPLQCDCVNNGFVDYLQREFGTKFPDFNGFSDCPFLTKGTCETRRIIKFVFASSLILYFMVFKFLLKYFEVDKIYNFYKHQKFYKHHKSNNDKVCTVTVKYAEKDEEIVLKEILPVLKEHFGLLQSANQNDDSTKKEIHLTMFNPVKNRKMTFVIFSQNYLISHYSHVNIKAIRGEMMKAKYTIYVFVDIGTENTIFDFLKEHRDKKTMMIWNEAYFWKRSLDLLLGGNRVEQSSTTIVNTVATRAITNNVDPIPHNDSKDFALGPSSPLCQEWKV